MGDPVDWNQAYVDAETPWDLGRPLPLLVDAIADGRLGPPGSALAPGAGRGHDAAALKAAGWDVTVVDLSPVAAAYAAEHYPDVRYVVGDALDPAAVLAATGGPVDLLWDHTFFCAVPLDMPPLVGALAGAVVKPGGLVASGVFPVGRDHGRRGPRVLGGRKDGPPWGYDVEDMDAVLDGFARIFTGEAVQVRDDMPWPHRLAVWQRIA